MKKDLHLAAGIAGLFIAGLSALAQGGVPVLDRVPGHRVTFHWVLADGGLAGDATVQGSAYRLTAGDYEVWSDGTVSWVIDREAREVLVQRVEEEDIFSNPALIVGSYRLLSDRLQVHAATDDSLDATVSLDGGNDLHFRLTGIAFHDEGDISDFVFDAASLDASYVVTDLR